MYTGCTTNATRRSDTAKLQRKVVDGERSVGVLNMAASTKELPIMDMSINGALSAQFTMVMVLGLVVWFISPGYSAECLISLLSLRT